LRHSKTLFLLWVMLAGIMFYVVPSVHGAVSVSITPGSQVMSQFGASTFTISLPGAVYAGSPYALAISGLGASFPFSPNPVSPPATSVLTVDLSSFFACPGTYPFTVTAANATGHGSGTFPDAGTGTASFTVIPYGPPLQVTVTTDKSSYRIGDTVTILISANRPAEGQLMVQGPSGTPVVASYNMGYGYGVGPSYTVQKTLVVNTVGRYTATFQADDFCSVSASQTAYFDVTPNTFDVSISLSGVPPDVSAPVKVDNSSQGTVGGSEIKKLTFPIDTSHQIAVDQYVPGQTGVRYFAAQNTWSISATGSHTFDYETQYLFTVKTDPDGVAQVTGGDWFKEGSSAQTGPAPQTVQGSAGTQYIFKDWEVDGVPQSGNPITLTLDKQHTAVAKYVVQYQLIVDSPGGQGNPQGSGFYDTGSTAQFSVTSPVGFLVQQVFVKWDGDYTGTSPQGSVVMDNSKIVHAVWATSYFQLEIVAIALVAIAVVAALLLMKRRREGPPPAVKPTPPMPGEPGAETGEPAPALPGESLKCSECGADVPSGQTFCHNCGAPMGPPSEHQT